MRSPGRSPGRAVDAMRVMEGELFSDIAAGRSAQLSPSNTTRGDRFTNSCKFLACGIAGAVVILLITIVNHQAYQQGSSSVCHTGPCRDYAFMLKEAIDTDQDPCDDFYKYVCGGWEKKRDRSVFQHLIISFVTQLCKTLEAPVPRKGQHSAEKAAQFFQSCVMAATSDTGELDHFRQVWHDIGIDWPKASNSADILRTLIRLPKRLRTDNIFSIYSGASSEFPILYLSSTNVISRMHDTRRTLKRKRRYRRYYETMQALAKSPDTTNQDLLGYSRLNRIEGKIYPTLVAAATWRPGDHSVVLDNLSTLAELTDIDFERWSEVLSSELGIPSSVPVIVVNMKYTHAFFQLMKDVGETELHRFVGWINTQIMAPIINKHFRSLLSLESSMELDEVLHCAKLTESFMGWATYARYAAQEFDADTKQDIQHITDTIINTTAIQLSNKSRLLKGNTTLHSFLQWRLKFMLTYIYRAENQDLLDTIFSNVDDMTDSLAANMLNVVNGTSFINNTVSYKVHTDLVSEASSPHYQTFSIMGRKRILPPYATVLPLYAFRVTSAVKYGSLGRLIARAAIHSLRYHSPAIFEDVNCTVESDGKGSVLESVLAVQIARQSHKASSPSADEVVLLGLPDLTGPQIFFITACYLLCGQPSTVIPAEFMCNEQSKQHPEFSKAFSCSKGRPMYSTKRCHL
ncbi:neprilysin-1-like [Ornithodoros turicata]|uniref:neprilysin-1-like n=1 Tax=Ornithodoros turicata TaxID=34597 RepID=UPI0031396AC8